MQVLILLVVVVVVAVSLVMLVHSFTSRLAATPLRRERNAALEKDARWEVHTESSGGVTSVVVRRVARSPDGGLLGELGRQTVASINDGDAQWEERYHDAMARARSRMAALDSQAD